MPIVFNRPRYVPKIARLTLYLLLPLFSELTESINLIYKNNDLFFIQKIGKLTIRKRLKNRALDDCARSTPFQNLNSNY